MEEISDADLIEALTAACDAEAGTDFESVAGVASALRPSVASADDPITALIAGLEYHLQLDDDRRTTYGPFGPMWEMAGKAYPPPVDKIEEVAPGTLSVWSRASSTAPLAAVKARFADLLWEAKYGERPYEHAVAAVDAYIEGAGADFGNAIERADGLKRAVEIASQINDQTRRARAIRAAVDLTQTALASEERMPGVALRLLELFVDDREDRRPPELSELLQAAIERYGEDPWNLESALDLLARVSPEADRREIHERQARAFAEFGRQATGLVKYAHFQHAIETASDNGLTALAEELRREVKGIPAEEFDLHKISVEVSISTEDVEAFIEMFVGDDDVESALARFGSHIPSGDPDDNRKVVEQLMAEHPLQFLFTRMTLGPENSLIRATEGEDEHRDQALIDHEAQHASMFSLFAVEILKRIGTRYGPISDAANWFRTDLIDDPVASRIGRALELFESDDADSAASVLAPRLERVVRKLAATVGLSVTRSPDRGGRPGGVRGLGELLSRLEGSIPEPTRRYLRVLLSEVTGLNLRNRVGHGLDDTISQREAALLIHAACHIRLLVPAD